MGNLAEKAEQLEKAIQESAFDGIQERRDYDRGTGLLDVAKEVMGIAEKLAKLEGVPTPDRGAKSGRPGA